MKIGIVTPRYPPNIRGGGEISVKLLVDNLIERGVEVEVLSFDGDIEDIDKNDPDHIRRINAYSNRADLLNLQGFNKIRRFAEDKEVLHSYNTAFHPSVGLIGRMDDVKTVATLNNIAHHQPYDIPNDRGEITLFRRFYEGVYLRTYSTISRIAMKDIDRFLALSSHLKQIYANFLPEDRIKVIPNMYDPDFPIHHPDNKNENEILYVGALYQYKGVKDLVKQMTTLENHQLRIVGDGPIREDIEELTKELEVSDRIIFEGYISNNEKLANFYSNAEWFVHPARQPEAFGRTILEAMQNSTAVLATNKGGPKDILQEKQLLNEMNELPEMIEQDTEEIVRWQKKRLNYYSPENVAQNIILEYKKLCT